MTYAFDPELAANLALLPQLDTTDLPTARTTMAEMRAAAGEPDATGVQVRDELVPGPDGAPDVRLRIYTPDRRTAPAGIFDVHGGGFILGDLDTDHAKNLHLARQLGAVVVSVDYRLAPEHPFPAPLEDCYAGLVWTAKNADVLGIDADRRDGVTVSRGPCVEPMREACACGCSSSPANPGRAAADRTTLIRRSISTPVGV